jgi:hypothetical protein
MTRLITGAVAGTLSILLTLTAGLSAFTHGTAGCPTAGAQPAGAAVVQAGRSHGPWDAEQLDNARTIVTVGERLGVPPRGQIIALATAIQESGLHNTLYGDADSLGLFQQRPSAGWGTPAQIVDPSYAAGRFYQALIAVPGWQDMPLTQAAQSVRRSAFPLAYADEETAATGLYAALSSGGPTTSAAMLPTRAGPGCSTAGGDGLTGASDVELPDGFALPAGTPTAAALAVPWALEQLSTPYSYGGDCTAPHSADPAQRCDCAALVISSSTGGRGADLGVCVLDAVVDGAAVLGPGHLGRGAIVAET